MKHIRWKAGIATIALLFAFPSMTVDAYTDYTKELTYVYSSKGVSMNIPTSYEYKRAISLKSLEESLGVSITSLADMFVKENGELYVVEKELGAILCFDEKQEFSGMKQEFYEADGSVITLNKPEGVFVSDDHIFYIADTGNNRIIVAKEDGSIIRIIERPENILGTDLVSFIPTSLVVDSVGRISVVARNINSGIMQFSKDGVFTGYTGAPSVSIDAFTKLLRKISTAKQKAQMQTYVPTEYNNIKIDAKNFIWGTISSISATDLLEVINGKDLSGAITPIKKLNTMGVDVLNRKGVYAPVGDLIFTDDPSKIVDVGIGPNNIYSLLDNTKGRIFTYNNDGILLYAFGNKGTKKGNMQTPAAIDYIGKDIYVLDSGLCQILIYEPTYYGNLLIDAEGYYDLGDYNAANAMWKEVAELNSNFSYAYIGLGNALYSNGEYEEAMEYYEYANDAENYSKAKEKLRKETSEGIFPIVFCSVFGVMILSVSVAASKRIRRYVKGEELHLGKGEEE
ncbi:MAG: hypothetical protein E7256_03605 [Lachnospiraceae bacterium]|nr:hypothetical protein [Lachnospiraceae bacterium]